MFGGAAAAAGGGKVFKETVGKNTGEERIASHSKKVTNVKELRKHQSLAVHGSEAGIEANRKKVELAIATLVGAGIGFGSSAYAAEMHAGISGGNVHNGMGGGKLEHTFTQEQMEHLAKGDKNGHYYFEHRPNASAGHELPQDKAVVAPPAVGSEHLAVDGKIHTADQMLGHFAEKLQNDFKGVDHGYTPKSVETYLKLFQTQPGASLLQGENHAALGLGLRGHHGLSEIMHPGDTIALNEHNQVVIHWADHMRPPHVLIEGDGEVNYDVDDLTGAHHMGGVHHVGHPHESHQAHHQARPETSRIQKPHAAPVAAPVEATSASAAAHEIAPPASDDLPKNVKDIYATQTDPNRFANTPSLEHSAPSAAPIPEAAHIAPEFEHAPTSVNTVVHSEIWEQAKGADATKVLSELPSDGNATEVAFREHLFTVMRESGVGPEQNQSVDDYLK